jgi:hypothetical protein
LTVTITVRADIATAPIAGGMTKPPAAKTPAAGIAIAW